VVAVADVRPEAGPLLVVSCEQPNKSALRDMVKGLIPGLLPGHMPLECVWAGDTLLIGSPANVARYPFLKSTPRDDLSAGLKSAVRDGASAGAIVAAGDDVRRAVRELWPTLPQPYRDLDAGLLADGVRHLTLTVRRPREWHARLALVARDETSAGQLKGIINQGLVQLVKLAGHEPASVSAAMLNQAIPLLRPQQSGSELIIEFAHDNVAAKSLVAGSLLPATANWRTAAQRNAQINDMKQIALGMYNFVSANKHFPAAAAICDKEGKPLLSWRVAILPYIDEQALYNQFHFDEPWDSEHNLKLAKQSLPDVYLQNMSKQLKAEGKTTYQVPVTDGTGFMPQEDARLIPRQVNGVEVFFREGLRLRDVSDGTSQTLLLTQVADEHAVFWTQPKDWSPDLADPVAKLRQEGRDGFIHALMDGSARYNLFSIDRDVLKSILTYKGGETN
jgi:hypothetical protein